MKYRVASLVLSTALLAPSLTVSASAGEGAYRRGGWGPDRTWCRSAWHGQPHGCGVSLRIYYYSPARDYAAVLYNSRGGVGRGYATTAYSTDGYPHHYAK
jgi:hypothetical protein